MSLDFILQNRLFTGHRFTANLGFYDDNTLGEIFLRSGKSGTEVETAMLESALAASFALQFGASPEIMADAMPRDAEGRPEGPLGTLFEILRKEVITP